LPLLLAVSLLSIHPARAEPDPLEAHEYDPEIAEDINQLCAGCHGEFGEGGGDGEYPRLAGLPAQYLENQLRAFKSGERHSIAMAMYATDRELPESDLLDISIYHSKLELRTRMPDLDPEIDAYQRLLIAKRVLNIARFEGDTAAGRDLYSRQCRKCHGADGKGSRSTPQLQGQHTVYLRHQIESFRSGERKNHKMEPYLQPLVPLEIENLLAFLSIADD
jgi:cytochrome c553